MESKRRKAALITGAAKGIGRQIAYALAEEGYDIAVNFRSDERAAVQLCREAEGLGVKALPVYGDLSKMEDIRAMFDKVFEVFPVLDVLVNNAGISSEVSFLEATEEMFDHMTAIDWKGVFFSSQIAAKNMIAHGVQGVIVNISSNQVEGCWPDATIYASTKAAVSKFTRNAAMELSFYGIRMVAVAPGYTDVGWAPDDKRRKAADKLPLRRFATTREIAKGVVYLISQDAAYITGTALVIDGGATLPVVAANDFVED
jgi:NAD(P)-dependent dehydrogenase (short-subunit alcohol dehydrogenase family)